MNIRFLLTTLCVLAFTWLHAAQFALEAGTSLVEVSGVRPYAAAGNLNTSNTSSLWAPLLRVSCAISDQWSAGLGYASYSALKGSGVAPTSDIFNAGSAGGTFLAVITPFASTETIQDYSFDVRYRLPLSGGFSLEVGPTVSWFVSRATIAYRNFSDSEVRFGGAAQLNYHIDEAWSLGLGYRLVKPTDRTLQSFTLSVTFRPKL